MLTAAVYPKVVLNRDGHPVVSGLSGFDGLNLSIGAVKKIATDAGGSWDDETIRLVEQLVREGAIETTRVVVAYWLYLGQVGRNMGDLAGSNKSKALAEKVCRQRNLTFDDLSFCHLRAEHFMRRGPHLARGDGRVVRPPVEWTKKKPEGSKRPKESRPRQTTGPERANKAKSGNSPGAGSSRPPPDSGGNAPSNKERRLFEASAYSNPFWSDTIDNENLKNLRNEIWRRRQAQGHVSNRLQVMKVMSGLSALASVASCIRISVGTLEMDEDTLLFFMAAIWVAAGFAVGFLKKAASYKQIINAGVTYRCEWLHKRSVARFRQWHGSVGSTDPRLYAEVVNWLQRERQHWEEREQERLRIEKEERWRNFGEAMASASASFDRQARANEQSRMDNEARQRDRHEPGYRGHDYEGDRRRAEANEQARQEASRRASGPTCVFCNQPGIASTASGWMCGLHAQGLL